MLLLKTFLSILNFIEQIKHISMENIFVNTRYANTKKCTYINQMKFKKCFCMLHANLCLPLFLRYPPLDPACPPFLFHPLLRYFRQSPPPLCNPLLP